MTKTVTLNKKHQIIIPEILGVNHTTFMCYVNEHGFTCMQDFDYCPSCGAELTKKEKSKD